MKQSAGTYRFRFYDKNTLLVQEAFRKGEAPGHAIDFWLDGQALSCEREGKGDVTYRVSLPPGWERGKNFSITDSFQGEGRTVFTISIPALGGDMRRLFFNIENCQVEGGTVYIRGWVLGSDAVDIQILDSRGVAIAGNITRSSRQDVLFEYDHMPIYSTRGAEGSPEAIEAGFQIKFPADVTRSFQIRFTCGEQTKTLKTTVSQAGRHAVKVSAWKRFSTYLGREGWSKTVKRMVRQLARVKARADYPFWYKAHQPSKWELERQRWETFAEPVTFSIVIPLYRTKEIYLKELLDSILAQTYPRWELCLADGSGREASLEEAVRRLGGEDPRIHYRLLDGNLGIAANTNAAIEMAGGDFIVLADHDDLLAPSALYECAKALQQNPQTDVIYTDEDKVDITGKTHFEPNFKPDFSPDYLRSVNYICHLFVVKRSLTERTGFLRQEYDGAQDYDFILRCCEQAEQICHIPKILYHWRCHMESTAANPESKLYAFEAGRRALEAHYKRLGIPAAVENAEHPGMYHTVYHWDHQPLVSILIPNKDHVEDLKKCLDSIEAKSAYRNYECIVIENNSTQEETFRYYEEIKKRPNVTVVEYQGAFNYSRINNFGERYAKGEYLILLNNDTEMMDENCIQELLGYCMREDVGIVGARLWYEDDTIQHAGVVVGLGGVAGHAFTGAQAHETGYQKRILCAQNYSAVTAACMMVKRELYWKAGGLTEELAVAFNDTDFCLKIRELGKLVVYNPYVQLHHYESKSRGYEDTPEKIQRFKGEIAEFQRRWAEFLKRGDPYYNPNLTLGKCDFSLD